MQSRRKADDGPTPAVDISPGTYLTRARGYAAVRLEEQLPQFRLKSSVGMTAVRCLRVSKIEPRERRRAEKRLLGFQCVPSRRQPVHPSPNEAVDGDDHDGHDDRGSQQQIEITGVGRTRDGRSQTNGRKGLVFEMLDTPPRCWRSTRRRKL